MPSGQMQIATAHIGHVRQKSTFEHAQNAQIQIICARAKFRPGLCAPVTHFVISNDSVADSEGPDQTVWMRRLI